MRRRRFIPSEKCTNAVIFARVSSEKQEKGVSIDAQIDSIYQYCKNKGLSIIKEFIITESSTRGDRKQYQEMLKYVVSCKQKIALVVNCVDRLQRSYKDTPTLDELRKNGKKENLILSKDSRGMDILFWNMCVLMANSYVLSLSDNVRRSLEFNWSQGKWQGYAPLGYLNIKDQDGKSKIIIDKRRAPLIKRLFEEYATGLHSAESLAILAKKLGLKTKNKKVVSRHSVFYMLHNPFYYGVMDIKGNLIPHIHGKIIDKELFDKVQEIIETRTPFRKQQKYKDKTYIFRGLITCGRCGHFISYDEKIKPNGKRYVYLRCYNKCGQPSVNETVIIEQLQKEIFHKLQIPKEHLKPFEQSISDLLDKKNTFDQNLKKNTIKRLDFLSHQETTLLNLFSTDHLEEDTYQKQLHSLISERKELENIINDIVPIDNLLKYTIEQFIELVGNIENLMQVSDSAKQNEILNLILLKATLNNKKLTYTLKTPFNLLLQCKTYKGWKKVITQNLKSFSELKYNLKMINK